ncbi:hypothetical protein [Amycolatopsis alkalitolerans]|uniref:hypothetical protein n=1 Tax=Amycolatopsis alkalitolerans TaxID=2547244 RepID=UPI00190F57FF|nr:hypothetical protein [Amycolatopsis alkalitolerans]
MAAAIYFLITVLCTAVALILPAGRRWLRSRQRPWRTVAVLAGGWLAVLIVLVASFPAPPQVDTVGHASGNAPSSTQQAPSSTTAVPTTSAAAVSCTVRYQAGQPLPDPACTPGQTNPAVSDATVDSTICRSGWTETVRPAESFTESLKADQIRAYGYRDVATGDYEEDHLIPLELGGAPSDPRNLWPEPGHSPNPKDEVENTLRNAVCAHRIDLAAAQHAIVADWTTAVAVLGLSPAPSPATKASTPPPAPATPPRPAPAPAPVQQPPVQSDPLAGRYHAGEFCSKANLGVTTTATNGATITCEHVGNYNRWED